MNVIQSYLTSIMKGDFSLYEVRIFVKIVEHANHILKGQRISSLLGRSISVDGITANMAIPISELLSENTHNWNVVIEAAKKLSSKTVEYWCTDTHKWMTTEDKVLTKIGGKKQWYYTHLIDNLRYKEGDGMLRFTVSVWLLEYILDFINGNFSMYDLQSALTLPSAYAVRMYMLTCSATKPIPYPIQMLREMLGVGDKYKTPKDFIKRCIEPPRKILEERGLNGYNYSVIHKTKGAKTSPITAILLIPIKRQTATNKQITAKATLSAWCNPQLKAYLTTQAGFSIHDLESIKADLFEFQHLPDWQDKIVHITNGQRKKRAGIGYVINAIRSVVSRKATVN